MLSHLAGVHPLAGCTVWAVWYPAAAGVAVTGCGCPTSTGRIINDVAQHAAWHRLVVEQGGSAGTVNATTLLKARGITRSARPEDVEPDPEMRRQNYAHMRSTAIAVLLERQRTWGSS